MRPHLSVYLACLLAGMLAPALAVDVAEQRALQLPPVGPGPLLILTPSLLELNLTSALPPNLRPPAEWNFVDSHGQLHLPAPTDFQVLADGKNVLVQKVGFKRRASYAPLKSWDLRVANSLYLQLKTPLLANQAVEVRCAPKPYWPPATRFFARADGLRWSPVLHINQTGYLPGFPKKAMVGYYLGTLGELNLAQVVAGTNSSSSALPFALLDTHSNKEVFRGLLTNRPDAGFPFPCYQHVLEADFSGFNTPGEYRLFVPGLGTSFPFLLDAAIAGAFARTYALGLYHQRCGTSNALPFTRFTHGACHTKPAEVPSMAPRFNFVNQCLSQMSADFKDNPRHTAPQLKNVAACLYPFVDRGPVDVSGGHHDAGDYSKYTINSAALVHYLVFAADAFPGVASLDNLGLPESGDGKSDILQEAKWEADFLARMQDRDGGFYFLVYPLTREYEDNVLPDAGDPQVVFPKNTAATAAATAALAQCASSPEFRKEFPQAAALYLTKAKKGWEFLQAALTRYGQDGAYQKITHYGNDFMHDDELAWAACELFLATGDSAYQKKLIAWLNPADPNTRRWGWWRLYASYGCAIRSYAFAARTGRLRREQLNPLLLEQCENEIAEAGADQLRWAQQSAYGTSFPEPAKRNLSAGWYFSGDAAFDLAVACQLSYPPRNDPREKMREALLSNLNYAQGCNPLNVTYVTGLGWRRQHEIVHQYALNDRRILPPSGIPLGNIQTGIGWNYRYQDAPDKLSCPSDGNETSPYPFYDRWADAFNLSQEFVVLNQGRALGYLAWLMAQTYLKDQPWRAAPGQFSGLTSNTPPDSHVRIGLRASGIDFSAARIVWETSSHQLQFGLTFSPTQSAPALQWLEAEAQLPDGRRVFAAQNFSAPR